MSTAHFDTGQTCAAALATSADGYANGEGVAMDEVEAYAWYYLPDSHYRKNIGPVTFSDERFAKTKSMSPQQVAAGKLRAKELRSQIDAKLKRGGK